MVHRGIAQANRVRDANCPCRHASEAIENWTRACPATVAYFHPTRSNGRDLSMPIEWQRPFTVCFGTCLA